MAVTTCRDVMKAEVECLGPEDTVQQAARRMWDENIGFIPVCDERRHVLGTITDRDLAMRIVADGRPVNTKLSTVMTHEVVACRPDDPISRARELMAEKRKSRMMVLDSEDRLVGVISLSDVVEISEDQEAAATMREVASREARI
jgi:CBS domain-containing protein